MIGLDLAGNGLRGPIPPQLGGLDRLVELDLSRNSLQGDVPTSLTSLAKLELLNLSMNHLTSTPDVTGMPALRKVYLTDNSASITTVAFSNHRENIETDQRARIEAYANPKRTSGLRRNVVTVV